MSYITNKKKKKKHVNDFDKTIKLAELIFLVIRLEVCVRTHPQGCWKPRWRNCSGESLFSLKCHIVYVEKWNYSIQHPFLQEQYIERSTSKSWKCNVNKRSIINT